MASASDTYAVAAEMMMKTNIPSEMSVIIEAFERMDKMLKGAVQGFDKMASAAAKAADRAARSQADAADRGARAQAAASDRAARAAQAAADRSARAQERAAQQGVIAAQRAAEAKARAEEAAAAAMMPCAIVQTGKTTSEGSAQHDLRPTTSHVLRPGRRQDLGVTATYPRWMWGWQPVRPAVH